MGTVWNYEDSAEDRPSDYGIADCPYCATRFSGFLEDVMKARPFVEALRESDLDLLLCPTCGWWAVQRSAGALKRPPFAESIWRATGSLRRLSLTDLSTPVDELHTYLVAKYGDRHTVHPKLFEQIVGAVFKNAGYQVRVTASSGDGGIDIVVFDGPLGDLVGVQVKRYHGKIEAAQIREFAGALLLRGMTTGIYVTTSEYTKGAVRTTQNLATRGYAVSLWDAATLYDRLRISRRAEYAEPFDPSAPFARFVHDPSTIPFLREFPGDPHWL